MDIKFSCPHCQRHIQAGPEYAGMQINCPSCNGPIIIPGAQPIALAVTAPPLIDSPSAPPQPAQRSVAPAAKPTPAKNLGEFSMGLGVAGALIGAVVGSGAMYGFFLLVGFRFPLLGVGIGFLTGLGAKLLGRGTESTLGAITGVIALIAVVGTLYLMYGEFPIMSIISVAVSVSVAYRISSG
jgi:hypothetical protein